MGSKKQGFSIERVCTMAMMNLAFLSMSCMLCAYLFMFHTHLNDMWLAIVYGAFTLFVGIYSYCHMFKFRDLVNKNVQAMVDKRVTEIMSNNEISARLQTKVEKAVTDRIEKSEVIRLDEVPNPEIVHPQTVKA